MASGDTIASFTPQGNQQPASGYMVFNLKNQHFVLEATAGATDTAVFAAVMPRNYGGGGITAYVTWASKTSTTGNMGFDVTFERDSGGSGDDIAADHWQTPQVVTAATVPATANLLAISSVAITAGLTGTASIAAGDGYRVRVRRLSTDTAAGVAEFLSLELKET